MSDYERRWYSTRLGVMYADWAAPREPLRTIHRTVRPARLGVAIIAVVGLAAWKIVELLPL